MNKENIKQISQVDAKIITDNGEEKIISLRDFSKISNSYISVYKNNMRYPYETHSKYIMDFHIEAEKYNTRVVGGLMDKREIDGVEVNGKSIITALKIIKQVCEDNVEENCINCPMFINSECGCGITDLEPHNWKVLEYEKFQALG